MLLGQRIGATATDVQKLNTMYKCNGIGEPSPVSTNPGENQGNAFHIF